MTLETKKCKICKKTISSPKKIPICDACRNKGKQGSIGLILITLTKTLIKRIKL